MFLYKPNLANSKLDRDFNKMVIGNEKLERPLPIIEKPKDKVRFIKSIESIIRASDEYRDYIKFLKTNMDMNRCEILRSLKITNGKKYKIELHHEPFTLYDIVETIVNKFDVLDQPLNRYKIADEVMELHYEGNVGLVPLSKTMHDLVGAGQIFIPLQKIYHRYDNFYKEYEAYMNPLVIEKVQTKANLSMQVDEIMSDILTPNFTYLEVDGVNLPEVPDEWRDIFKEAS